jgi:hypothetical protein
MATTISANSGRERPNEALKRTRRGAGDGRSQRIHGMRRTVAATRDCRNSVSHPGYSARLTPS